MQTIRIPKVKTLLNERPEGMSYEEYRQRLKEQKQFLHGYWKEEGIGANGQKIRSFVMGRLSGTFVPSAMYKNSRDPKIVIG